MFESQYTRWGELHPGFALWGVFAGWVVAVACAHGAALVYFYGFELEPGFFVSAGASLVVFGDAAAAGVGYAVGAGSCQWSLSESLSDFGFGCVVVFEPDDFHDFEHVAGDVFGDEGVWSWSCVCLHCSPLLMIVLASSSVRGVPTMLPASAIFHMLCRWILVVLDAWFWVLVSSQMDCPFMTAVMSGVPRPVYMLECILVAHPFSRVFIQWMMLLLMVLSFTPFLSQENLCFNHFTHFNHRITCVYKKTLTAACGNRCVYAYTRYKYGG